MARSSQGSGDDSAYPRDGQNQFVGKSASPAETVGEQQSQPADTTEETGTEPAEPERSTSDSDGPPGVDDVGDTTSAESTPSTDQLSGSGDEPEAGDGDVTEATGESQPDQPPSEDTDAPTDGAETSQDETAGDEPSGEGSPDEEAAEGPAFQYHGTEPESEEHEDYAYISGVDPDQRYETVEDLVHSHEELLQHTDRQQDQVQRLQEKVTDLQATKEGELEEAKAKLSLYEEQLGEDQIVDALAERHMPEEFQGLTREDVPADQEEEFLRARWEAEKQAEEQLEEAQAAKEEAEETARERRQRLKSRADEAADFLESVGYEDLGVDAKDEPYVKEAVADLTPDGMEEEKNVFDIAYDIYTMAELVPDEFGVGSQEAEAAAEYLVELVGHKARAKKRQEMESRAEKIQTQSGGPSASRASEPEPAQQESATREVKSPETTFRRA